MDRVLAAPTPTAALDAVTLLRRIDQRIALLRAWLSHHHGDEPYWWARKITPSRAQRERSILRQVANLLHVERATARGRLHGTRCSSLEAQRAWLARWQDHRCAAASELAGLPPDATLARLRAGELPL